MAPWVIMTAVFYKHPFNHFYEYKSEYLKIVSEK